jgi:uncharacterized membrane protein YoaK (UPF0700 family)
MRAPRFAPAGNDPVTMPHAPPSAVMTTNLTRLVADLARLLRPDNGERPAESTWSKQAQQLLWLALGCVTGCALGAAGFNTLGWLILAAPLALIGLAAVTSP